MSKSVYSDNPFILGFEERQKEHEAAFRRIFENCTTVTIGKHEFDAMVELAAILCSLKDELHGRPIETTVFSGNALCEVFDLASRLRRLS